MNELVKAFYSDDFINIERNFNGYKKIVKKYPRLGQNCCLKCKFPSNNCDRHKFFFDASNRDLIKEVSVLGYYRKMPYDSLTEDIRFFRNLKLGSESHVIYSYIYSLTVLLCQNYLNKINKITFIPSKRGKNQLIPQLMNDISSELGIDLIDPSLFIFHDLDLHESSSTSKKHTLKSRYKFIENVFKYKEDNQCTNIGNILIFDDILDSGLSMHHFAKFLKKMGANEIFGISWLRTIESNFDFSIFDIV